MSDRSRNVRVAVVLLALGVPPAAAQTSGPAGGAAADTPLAAQLGIMEEALAQAVSRSAQVFEQQLALPAPGLVLFAGPTAVRGFRLADYGVFFDVQYPVLRQSILWSMQMLEADFQASLQMLRHRMEQMLGAPPGRAPGDVLGAPGDVIEEALREIEQGMRTEGRAPGAGGAPVTSDPHAVEAAGGAGRPSPAARTESQPVNPQDIYREALTDALLHAVLRVGSGLAVLLDGADWVAVAARDARGLQGRDTTIRIRAADLAALHDGSLSLDAARARIAVSPF